MGLFSILAERFSKSNRVKGFQPPLGFFSEGRGVLDGEEAKNAQILAIIEVLR
jgi:hypothetical protein